MIRVISLSAIFACTILSACSDGLSKASQDGIIIKKEYGDGPFGTYMNMPKEEFEVLYEVDFNLYKSFNVPMTNTAFEFYELSLPSTGLCMIQAAGVDIETDPAGANLKFEYDGLREALDKKYGVSDDFREEDSSDSDKSSPVSYMQRVVDGDQIRENYWWVPDEGVLPGKVESISLRSKALNEELGYLVVRYEFENYDDCEAMDKANELDSL